MAQTVRIVILFVISCNSFATAGELFPLKYNSKVVFRYKHGEVFIVKANSDPLYSTSVVHFSITKLNTVTELIAELSEQEAHGPYPVLAKQDIETRYLRVASTRDLVSEIKLWDHLILWSPGNENMGWLDFGTIEKSMTVCCIDKLPIGFTERDLQFLSISEFTRKNEARISQETVTIRTINSNRENGKK